MRLVVVIAILLGHHAAAHACKKSGKVIYREVQAPLDGHEDRIPNATFEILATGAWRRVQEMPEGQEPSSEGGCLKKAHLKEFVRALGKAKFALGTPEMCDAVADTEVVLSAPKRKKKVTVTSPCGTPADPTTERLRACAHADSDVRAICRGTR